jgi:hypothetical protein
MTGGTSKIIKVVAQSDVDSLRESLKGRGADEAANELKNMLAADGYFAIKETLNASAPKVTSDPKVGEEAEEVSVTVETTYTMMGVKQDSLSQLVKKEVEGKIDTSKQVILDDGVDEAVFHIDSKPGATQTGLGMQTLAIAGPHLDEEAIKNDVRGKKLGDAQKAVLARPGIKDVSINFKPFWVFSTPKAAKKIIVTFEPEASSETSAESDEGDQQTEAREVPDTNGAQP